MLRMAKEGEDKPEAGRNRRNQVEREQGARRQGTENEGSESRNISGSVCISELLRGKNASVPIWVNG